MCKYLFLRALKCLVIIIDNFQRNDFKKVLHLVSSKLGETDNCSLEDRNQF